MVKHKGFLSNLVIMPTYNSKQYKSIQYKSKSILILNIYTKDSVEGGMEWDDHGMWTHLHSERCRNVFAL